MNPANHDPDLTGLPVSQTLSPEHGLAQPLGRLADAAEALQTWASDLASRRSRRPSMTAREAKADQLVGEKLLGEVLTQAAPVIGHLSSVGGGQ